MTTPERAMIERDGWQMRQVLGAFNKLHGAGILGTAFLPYIAFYVVEAHRWLHESAKSPPSETLASHHSALRAVRARIKILDSGTMSDTSSLFEQHEKNSVTWFNQHHRGILRRLKLWLQDDLGVSYYGGNLAHTTHIALANISVVTSASANPFDKNSKAGQDLRDFSFAASRFVRDLTENVAKDKSHIVRSQLVGTPDIRYEDHKAAKFYAELRRKAGLGSSHVAAFMWLISQTNLVHHWLRSLFESSDGIFFRFKFLTTHHALSSLDRLSRAIRGNRDTQLGQLAAELLTTSEAKELRRASVPFRNALAHYQLRNVQRSISAETPLSDLVLALSPWTFAELDALLDAQMDGMSAAFRRIVSPGFFAVRLDE